MNRNDNLRYLLGRLPSAHDPRTLRLRTFLTAPLPPPPPTDRHDTKITDWGVMGNDVLGNCVIVTAAHAIMAWYSAARGITDKIPDAKVISLSHDWHAEHGYSILDRNKRWHATGMLSNKLHAYTLIDPKNTILARQVCHTFGAVDIGLGMPAAWTNATIWDTGAGPSYRPYTWGGHSVPIVGYDQNYFYVATWGRTQKLTPAAYARYCDEAYAWIDPAWLDATGKTPGQLDMAALDAALETLTT